MRKRILGDVENCWMMGPSWHQYWETQNFTYNGDLLEACHKCNLVLGSVHKITTESTDPSSGRVINSQMCNWYRYTWCLTEYPHGYLVFGGNSIIEHKANMHLWNCLPGVKLVNQSQHCLVKIAEFNATLKDLKGCSGGIPILPPCL